LRSATLEYSSAKSISPDGSAQAGPYAAYLTELTGQSQKVSCSPFKAVSGSLARTENRPYRWPNLPTVDNDPDV
jgi:hypothetical protein